MRGQDRRRSAAPRRYNPLAPPPLRDLRSWSRADLRRWLMQFAMLNVGLFLFAVGVVLSLQCNLGANSWAVFQDGLARQTPLSFGQASQLVGIVMIGISWLAGTPPGLGTLLNMYLIGLYADLLLDHGWIPLVQSYPARGAMLLASLAVLGLATGTYIKAGFGAGPRDSFNLAVMERTGLSIGVTRWGIESVVVIVGILLGGRFGVGTILAALLIGPAVGLGFRLMRLTGAPRRPGAAAVGQGESRTTIIGETEPAGDRAG